MRYDGAAIAQDLARWCSGEVSDEEEAISGGQQVLVVVPTVEGRQPARLGDWVVRHGEGDFSVHDPTDFALHFEHVAPGELPPGV